MRIDADYLGGPPSLWDVCEAGTLTADVRSLRVDGAVLTTSLQTRPVNFTVSQAEIRATSVGDPNHMTALTYAFVGDAISGALGAWIGAPSAGPDHCRPSRTVYSDVSSRRPRCRRGRPCRTAAGRASDVEHRGALEAGLALLHVGDRQASEKL